MHCAAAIAKTLRLSYPLKVTWPLPCICSRRMETSMNSKLFVPTILGLLLTSPAWTQNAPANSGSVPIYSVTVVERTVKAVDYQYRNGPTPVDFRGTVLLPHAKGDALVESKAGRVEIDAKFDHLEAPTRYGPEYLTYVLWAVTPEGHAKNLGEVVASSSDHGHLRVTTDLQSFGMIVTAEPYSAVRQPSDVVVMENEIRPDTIGRTEPIMAKYELLPRGQYTYNVPADLRAAEGNGPRVSMSDYESLLEVYQAQNAVQIAQAQHADRYAPDTFEKAAQLWHDAQRLQATHAQRSEIVTVARKAAQTAEDARLITTQRRQAEEVAAARQQAAQEQALRVQAESQLQQTRAQAQAEVQQARAEAAEADRSAAIAQTVAAPAPQPAPQYAPPPPPPPPQQSPVMDASKTDLRVRLMRQLSGAMPTLDTPRGLVVTVTDSSFRGGGLNSSAMASVQQVALILASQPGLSIEVDGNTDDAVGPAQAENVSYERAAAVRDVLVRAGVPARQIFARGLGSSHPLTSNATPEGRQQNRRVEITVAGDPIGSMAHWDRTYTVTPH